MSSNLRVCLADDTASGLQRLDHLPHRTLEPTPDQTPPFSTTQRLLPWDVEAHERSFSDALLFFRVVPIVRFNDVADGGDPHSMQCFGWRGKHV